MTPLVIALFLLSLQQTSHADLTRLDDQHLADVTGQAPIYTSYIDPSASGNASGLGFYTLGINGTVSLNANIEHLQLGCGGVNGPGCDIDLSHVRLSGTSPGPSGTYADSDATLGNPFLQLAIKTRPHWPIAKWSELHSERRAHKPYYPSVKTLRPTCPAQSVVRPAARQGLMH